MSVVSHSAQEQSGYRCTLLECCAKDSQSCERGYIFNTRASKAADVRGVDGRKTAILSDFWSEM